ncbi:MAG: hypothetical protein ACI9G6_001710, partial [Limisphaerales bacterium]
MTTAFTQISTDCISGTVVDKETGEALPFATVQFFLNDKFLQGGVTDFDGRFLICGLPKLKQVDLQIDFTGYTTVKVAGVTVGENNGNLKIEKTGIILSEIVVKAFKVPLIEQDNTTSGQTVTSEEIRNLPTRNINQISGIAAGASSAKEGRKANMRGSRANATSYYVDGVRVGATSTPK